MPPQIGQDRCLFCALLYPYLCVCVCVWLCVQRVNPLSVSHSHYVNFTMWWACQRVTKSTPHWMMAHRNHLLSIANDWIVALTLSYQKCHIPNHRKLFRMHLYTSRRSSRDFWKFTLTHNAPQFLWVEESGIFASFWVHISANSYQLMLTGPYLPKVVWWYDHTYSSP